VGRQHYGREDFIDLTTSAVDDATVVHGVGVAVGQRPPATEHAIRYLKCLVTG
jgi:hypothetical protein